MKQLFLIITVCYSNKTVKHTSSQKDNHLSLPAATIQLTTH